MGESLGAPAEVTIRRVFDEDLEFITGVVRCVLGARRAADVEDVVSLALFAIDKSLHSFDPTRAPLRVWMYRIVERTARRYARKGRSLAARMVPWEEADELEGVEVLTEDLMSTDELRRLWDELSLLMSEEQRELLALHVLCGLTGPEIASLKGWNVNTTRRLITLAQNELAALHRLRQARQSRAGVLVLPLAFGAWTAHVEETAQRVPDAMRARLLARLEAGPEPEIEQQPATDAGPRPRARTIAPLLVGVPPASLPVSTAAVALAVLVTLVVCAVFLPAVTPVALTSPIAPAAEAPTTHAPEALALPTTTSFAAPPVATPSVPAPAAPRPVAPADPRVQELALLRAIRGALDEKDAVRARARLRDYDAHFGGGRGHFGADRDDLARRLAKLPP
jgi:RNA polymerase sigma-70 factor (ECF subfamily)